MRADQQEVLNRFQQVLVEEFGSRNAKDRNSSITVGDIYYDLVPFQACQERLGVESVFDYERALLRLLAGQGGILEMEALADRQKIQQHVNSLTPDPGILRGFLAAGVRVCSSAS